MPIELRTDLPVEFINQAGGDWLICDAARVSSKHAIGRGPRDLTDADKGLLNALVRQRHGGPFGHGQLTIFIEAPIFIFREVRTHKIEFPGTEADEIHALTSIITDTKSYSEASGRYRPYKPQFWAPKPDRPMVKAPEHKAMRPVYEVATSGVYYTTLDELTNSYSAAWTAFEKILSLAIAPEVARAAIPGSVYTAMYVSGNPLSIMRFMSLRIHNDANKFETFPQLEIQEIATSIEGYFAEYWPETHKAWINNGRIAF